MAQLVKNPPAMQETWVQSLGWEDPLEKHWLTHSSILAWRIPRTTSPWGHKESDTTVTFTSVILKFLSHILLLEELKLASPLDARTSVPGLETQSRISIWEWAYLDI